MTEMELLKYGWQGIVVALMTCIVIGIIKTPVKAVIKKRTNEVNKVFGAVAFCVSALFGAGGAVIFGCVLHDFALFSTASFAFVLWVIAVSQFLYAMYEKLGLREAAKKIIKLLAAAFGIKLPEETEKAPDSLLTGGTDEKTGLTEEKPAGETEKPAADENDNKS